MRKNNQKVSNGCKLKSNFCPEDFLNYRDHSLCLPFIFKATAIDFTVRTEE